MTMSAIMRRDVVDDRLLVGVAIAGLAIGCSLALAVAPVFANQLEAVRAYDAVAYLVPAAVVIAAAVAAAYAPSRQAVRIDPLAALRCD